LFKDAVNGKEYFLTLGNDLAEGAGLSYSAACIIDFCCSACII